MLGSQGSRRTMSRRHAQGSARIFRQTVGLFAVACSAAFGPAAAVERLAAGSAAAPTSFTDRVIIKYRDAAPVVRGAPLDTQRMQRVEEAAAMAGTRPRELRRAAFDARIIKLDRFVNDVEMQNIIAQLRRGDPEIEYAEPDRILHPLFTPNDPRYGEQWHYYEATAGIRAPAAWDKATGAGIVVAVIDTGYRPHADLVANVLSGYDFINDTFVANDGNGRDTNAQDPGDWTNAGECGGGQPTQNIGSSWHGTHVAGTIAAQTNNGVGVAGVAFNAKILPVRALGKCGGYTSDIADGIVWASGGTVAAVPANPTPARVLNLSLGGSGACDQTSANAIASARSRGTVVVVAAGNSGVNASNATPANCSGVVTVAAVNRSGGRSYYSNFGNLVTIAAPGGDVRSSAANGILSTLNTGVTTPGADDFDFYQGTSMATPHVAGVVALMLEKRPSLTPDQVATMLRSSARAFPAACSQCGAGIVDASAAVDAAIAGPGSGGGGSGNEVEPNDSTSTAQAVATPVTINGTMASTTDNDYFAVTVAAGRTLSATLTPNASSDYDLYVYRSNGQLAAQSVKGTGAVDAVSVGNTGTASAVFYVRVRYYGGATGASGVYALQLAF